MDVVIQTQQQKLFSHFAFDSNPFLIAMIIVFKVNAGPPVSCKKKGLKGMRIAFLAKIPVH